MNQFDYYSKQDYLRYVSIQRAMPKDEQRMHMSEFMRAIGGAAPLVAAQLLTPASILTIVAIVAVVVYLLF